VPNEQEDFDKQVQNDPSPFPFLLYYGRAVKEVAEPPPVPNEQEDDDKQVGLLY